MNELPRRPASSDSDGIAHDSARGSQVGSGAFKSAPGRPLENAPVLLHRTRRLLLGLAVLLALVTLGAFALALKQPVTGSRWHPAPTIFSWNGFIAPREINRWQRPVQMLTPNSLESVAFSPDGRSALAVGHGGTLLRSADGGQRWSEVASATKALLTSVAFAPDGRSALAVGLGGTVMRSDDGGQRWTRTALHQRQPAPWFWALMLIVASGSVGFAVRYVSALRATSTRRGLLDNGVSDSPITKAEQDKLLFNPVVEALSRFLRHAATRPPLAIAVNAAWGMGKSSFMNMLASRLKKMGARPVWFNVWHHQHEDVLLAPLLQAITQQAIPGLGQWEGWTFRWRLLRERWRRPDWAVLSGTAALLSVPAYLVWLAYRSDGTGGFWLQRMADRCVRDLHLLFHTLTGGQWIATAKGGGLGDVIAAAFLALREDAVNGWLILLLAGLILCWVMLIRFLMRPFPARPAILLASMDGRFSLSRAEAQTDFRQRFRRHFGDVTRALEPRTMTIFIDDLDRCKPEKAAELLESVNYLSDAGHCFVVLGVARDIVEAQVASAQKTLAEEQAAMERAGKNVPVTESATQAPQADKDRLDYARKYLRKLVQLDVNLPTLTGEQAEQLLLDRAEPGAAPVAPSMRQRAMAFLLLSFRWVRAQVASLLKWGIPLALIAGFLLQVILTLKDIDGDKKKDAEKLRAQVTGVRKELENVRSYENWLRRMSEAKAVDASLPGNEPAQAETPLPKAAASAPQEPTKSRGGTDVGLLYKAQADVVQLSVKAIEQALPLLEQEAETANTQSLKKLMDSRVEVARAAVKSYTDSNQLDGRKWEDIKAGMQPPRQAASSPTPVAGGTGKPDLGRAGSGGSEPAELETAWWPVAVGMFPVLVLLLWAWRANDPYTIQATPEYEAAVSFWQERLLKDPDTASPRELKRFMNLSRYAVARLRPQGAAAEESTLIPEGRIVEFTAKWLLARAASGPVNLRRMLIQPVPETDKQSIDGTEHLDPGMPEGWTQASAEEAELFLRVVGDLGSGEPEGQRQPSI